MLRGIFAFLAVFLVVSCETSTSRAATNNQEPQTATAPQSRLTDEALLALVRKFAAGVENEPPVFADLARHSRTEITDHLLRLQHSAAVENRDKIAIAFLLCHLNHEVEANKTTIVRALTHALHSRNPGAEWEVVLVGRLVKKGHKDLLPALFSAAEWADGAMATTLFGLFEDQLRTAPQEFVGQLSKQSGPVRKSVYTLLQTDELANTDVIRFRKYVNSITDPRMKSVARELLKAIRNGESH